MLLGGGIPLTPEDASKMTPNSSSFVGKLNPDPGKLSRGPGGSLQGNGVRWVGYCVWGGQGKWSLSQYGENRISRPSGTETFKGQSREWKDSFVSWFGYQTLRHAGAVEEAHLCRYQYDAHLWFPWQQIRVPILSCLLPSSLPLYMNV